ncbi:hypothetical protein J1N35_016658 [Gossypium stocksii]|uniref:Uncharacterized protein n=1 Tax=Gossypium stocksii TaxID=47602 RepID=A0A9D3VKN1_9ROSI|nr:hypothetical protein J1N35_016658 [Gossypium stocksii]
MGFLLKTFSKPDSILQARLITGRFDHYNTQMTFSTRADSSHRKHLLDSAVDNSSNCVFYSQHKTLLKVFAQTMAADKMLKHSHGNCTSFDQTREPLMRSDVGLFEASIPVARLIFAQCPLFLPPPEKKIYKPWLCRS